MTTVKFIQAKEFSRRCIFLFILLLINNTINAQQKDLQYYLKAAFSNSTSIQEDINNIQIKRLDRSLVNAQYSLPQVSLTANYLFAPYFGSGKVITTAPDSQAIGYDPSITNGGLYSAQINVTKNLFNGGLVDAYYSQSDLQVRSSENNIESLKHTLQRDITDQYLNCYQSQKLFELSKALTDTIRQQLNITRGLMLKGLAKETDYLLLKVELAGQISSSEQALSNYRSSLYQLNAACGLLDTATVELIKTELSRAGITRESNFLKQYLLDSLALINQQNIFETKYLPQFSIFANAGLNAVELQGIQRKFGMSAGFNFTLPIYDGSQKSIIRQQSEISEKTLYTQKQNQMTIIQNKIKETALQIDFYWKNMESINQQLKDYDQIIRLSHSELLRGQLTTVEFITIIKNFLELKKNEIQSLTGYQQAINQFNYWSW